ncbi:MAG TPA: hypothetical protein VGK47_09355 [Nitrososphaeraceae archaeon]
MSVDYYITCDGCNRSTSCFVNFDGNPDYFDVMKFIIEHYHQCRGSFRIIDFDKVYELYEKHGFQLWNPAHKALEHVETVIEVPTKESVRYQCKTPGSWDYRVRKFYDEELTMTNVLKCIGSLNSDESS